MAAEKHHRQERAQQQGDTFLRRVIENAAGVPFQIIFGAGFGASRYSYIGEGIQELLGIPAAEFTEASFNELVEEVIPLLPEIPNDPVECRRAILAGTIERYKADLRIRTKDGRRRWINDSSLPVRDEATGNVVGAIGMLTDITDRKAMEETARASEERFRSLFDRMMDGVYRSTHDGRFVEINDAMVRMFRFPSKEAMLNVDIKEELYFKEEDRESLFLDTGQEKIEVFRMRRHDGTEIWVEDHGQYVHDKEGNVIFHEGILRDITERVQAELVFREREKRYRTLFEGANDATLILQKDKFIECNLMTLRVFGCDSLDDIVGWTPWKFSPELQPDGRNSREKAQELIGAALAGKTQHFYWKHSRKDGSLFDAEVSLHPIGMGSNVLLQAIVKDVTERRHAEEEIATWRQRYELVATASRQVVYDYDLLTGAIAWSGSVKQVLGYDLDQMHGGVSQWLDLIEPNDRDRAMRLLDECRAKGMPYEVDYNFKHHDGHYLLVHDLGFFIADATGTYVRMIGVMQDITERKRTDLLQNAIYRISHASDKAASLEELFKSVHEIISTVMPAKNFYIALYDAAEDLIRFPYFIDEIDPPFPPIKPRKGLTEYVILTGKSLFCDEKTDRRLRDEGLVELVGAPSAIWIGVPLIIGDKAIGAMVVQHYTDPTAYSMSELHMLEYVSSQVARAIERRQAEERLRQSEEQFRLISENVADMIAVLDLDGRRLYNSPSYRNVLDDPDILRGTDSFQEIHPDDRDKIREIFQETVRTGTGHRAEYRFITKDGTIRHIESQGSTIKDPDGKISKIIVVSRDITDKKKLEQQFLRSQRMESIGTLAGGIAHDLNNVLAPIMLSLQVLQNRIKDADTMKILDTLSASARRGSDVVKQVLAFSRGIEGERMMLQPKHIIDEIVKIAAETFPRSIEIRADIPKNLWMLSADPTQIHQVLLNIFVNARDAMQFGGRILIKAENVVIDENYARMYLEAQPGHYICISISDTGAGIPAKILDKIFEPFFTTKEVGKGTGLGLSTALAIVKSHGGFMDVISEVNKGTTFKVYLQAQTTTAELVTQQAQETLQRGEGETILVVDDELPIREITKDTLESHGYRVLTACDGTEAVALFAQEKGNIRAVITDMMMPVMDGPATIRALQKIDPSVKIIASSGLVSNEETLKTSGAVKDFLTKPYTTEKLLRSLKRILSEE